MIRLGTLVYTIPASGMAPMREVTARYSYEPTASYRWGLVTPTEQGEWQAGEWFKTRKVLNAYVRHYGLGAYAVARLGRLA